MKKNKQTKKQKEATKTFWLVALVLALVAAIGLVQHHDDLKELANKDEVVEEAPEVETLVFAITTDDMPDEYNYDYKYEVGMTWKEFVNSKYNTDNLFSITENGYVQYNSDDMAYISDGAEPQLLTQYLIINLDHFEYYV